MENSKHTKAYVIEADIQRPGSLTRESFVVHAENTDKAYINFINENKNAYHISEPIELPQLYAAAPELLEACQAAIRIKQLWQAQNIDMHVVEQHAGEINALIEMENKLNAAIQKATL